jgi:hypothetical protein
MKRRKRSHTEILHSSDDLEAAPRPVPADSRSGTIEQQLDMNETGPLRGEEILRGQRLADPEYRKNSGEALRPLDEQHMTHNYRVDMSEGSREGAEETGDEHSTGLQGSDQQELQYDKDSPDHADSGTPGEMTGKARKLDPSQKGYKHRAA